MDIAKVNLEKLYIHVYPDPVLRAKAVPVEHIGPELAHLTERMIEMMLEARGVGLAGPQVGLPLRMFIISPDATREKSQVFINPEISNLQGTAEFEEGCLSLPDVRAPIKRAATCTVEATDVEGNRFTADLDDLAAIAAQHEYDHLEGTLFIDRLGGISKIACRKAIKRLEKEYRQE